MANYNGKSHYTHEVDNNYRNNHERIFGKKEKKEYVPEEKSKKTLDEVYDELKEQLIADGCTEDEASVIIMKKRLIDMKRRMF